jgi:hypothetical protein
MKNTDKVTLTLGQLKKLIKESIEEPVYVYSIHEIIGGHGPDAGKLGGHVHSNYEDEFETPEAALEDALNYLKKYKVYFYPDLFEIEVRDYTTSNLKISNYYFAKKLKPGIVEVKPVSIGIK